MALIVTDLAPVKAKLGLPVLDSATALALQLALDAAEEIVVDRTGFAPQAETGRVDRFLRAEPGRTYYLSRRPVTAIVSARGRKRDRDEWVPLPVTLLSPEEGEVRFSERDDYPVVSDLPVPRRSEPWAVVEVTYDVAAAQVPSRVYNAIVSLAAYLYIRESSHAIDRRSGGGISEQYRDEDMPPWVSGPLAPYERIRRVLWVG